MLGKALGRVKEMMVDGMTLWIHVTMDTHKHQRKSISIVRKDGSTLLLAVKYEKLTHTMDHVHFHVSQ